MKRRIIAPAALIAASGLILAGCGNGEDPEATDTAMAGGDGEMAAGCEAYADYGMHEGETVEVYATIQGQEADDLVTSFVQFEECTGITVDYVGTQEFETQINVRVEGGSPPDLAIFPQPGLLERIVDTGAIVPAPASVEANVDEFWSESWKQYGTINDTFHAAPLMASVKGWVWYSPTEFADNGYEVPTTWDEMMALTEELAAANDSQTYAPW